MMTKFTFPLAIVVLAAVNAVTQSVSAACVPSVSWRTEVGCHSHPYPGPGCWMPGFTGTDSTPALQPDGSVAISSYNSNIYSIDDSLGNVRWMKAGGGEGSPFTTSDNQVLIAGNGYLQCFDGEDGDLNWKWSHDWWEDGIGSIASAGAPDEQLGLVFAGVLNGYMYAVELHSGKTKWKYNAGKSIWSSLGPLGVKHMLCFGAGGSAIPGANSEAEVHCVTKSTGMKVWSARTGEQIQSRPSYGAVTNHLYVGDYDNCVYAFDVDTGRGKWKSCTDGRIESSTAVWAGDGKEIVLAGSGDGHVYAFDGASGDRLWRVKCNEPIDVILWGLTEIPGGGVLATPWVQGDVVYSGGLGITAVNVRTGEVLWRWGDRDGKTREKAAPFGSSPIVSSDGKSLYAGGEDGYLYALDISSMIDPVTTSAPTQAPTGVPTTSALGEGIPRMGAVTTKKRRRKRGKVMAMTMAWREPVVPLCRSLWVGVWPSAHSLRS